MLGGPALHALLDDRADTRGALGQFFVAHDVHHRETRGAGDGVSAVRAPEATGVRRVHHVCPPDDGGQRKAGGQALGDRHQVRLDTGVLDREELAGAAEAGLDLVGDEHDAVLPGQLAQPAHEVERRRHKAAFAKHRLDDDRRHTLG